MRIRAICSLVLAISATFAAGQSVPGRLKYSPSVSSTALSYSYTGLFESIRKVDFANLYYFEGDGKTGNLFQLRHGGVKVKYPHFGGEEVHLDDVYYFRPSTTQPEAALVQLRLFSYGGSSSMDCVLLVFQIDEGGLLEMQELRFDLQAEGTGVDFDQNSNTLTVRARTADDSPHCCAKSIDLVTFSWTGKAFEEKSHRTIPIKK
jgi:hypothetical protein